MNFKKGDKSDGVLAYKALLMLANDYNIINAKVDNSNSFGQGTYDATIAVQKYFNLVTLCSFPALISCNRRIYSTCTAFLS